MLQKKKKYKVDIKELFFVRRNLSFKESSEEIIS